jgi:hypothetical protein
LRRASRARERSGDGSSSSEATCQSRRTGSESFTIKKNIFRTFSEVEKVHSPHHKTPRIHHEKTTKTPSKNTHFSQNPCKNAIQRCQKKLPGERKIGGPFAIQFELFDRDFGSNESSVW